MEIPDELKKSLRDAVEKFHDMKKIRIVSHYDADGISSASIIMAACLRSGKKVHLSIVKQLRPDFVEKINEEGPENIIFTDLGSGHMSLINDINCKNIIVLDHHQLEGELESGVHVNPHLSGLGEDSISGAGITYLFVRELPEKNRDLSPLAVVGAIGDIQEEDWKMKGLNKGILEEAVREGLLERRKGLRLFGRLSRPVHKSLQYTTRPYIPGISDNESGAIQFLSEIDIDPKDSNGEWKRLKDLSEEEEKKLASAIIKQRINDSIEGAEEIFGNVYTLNSFEGRFRDAREFSTALNACGRMSQATVGVLACLGDEKAREDLSQIVEGYKKTLGKLLRKVRKDESMIEEKENVVFLDGIGRIPENFIGTVCSILHSKIAEGKILIGFAESENDKVKISVRVSEGIEINIGDVISEIVDELGGEGGGHEKAGGAYVEKDKKDEFVEEIEARLLNREAV